MAPDHTLVEDCSVGSQELMGPSSRPAGGDCGH